MKNIEQTTNNKETNNNQATTMFTGASTTTTSSSVNTQPGVHTLDAHEWEMIRQEYVNILGPLNIYKAQDIEMAVDHGLEASAILEAIEQTAMARRPSHYYLRAILKRYLVNNLRTAADVQRDREERARERNLANRQQWSAWYSSPDDYSPW